MRVIQFRISGTVCYLLALFLYGIVMMNLSIQDASMETINIRREQFTNISSLADFFDRMEIPETECKKLVEMGGLSCNSSKDGGKKVCFDADVRLVTNHCIVYSFGLGDDTTFDSQISQYGCKVYGFDHTIIGTEEANDYSQNFVYHPIGLYDRQTNLTLKIHTENGTEIKRNVEGDTLYNITRRMGHEEKSIHYLKMDIEGNEWKVIKNLVQSKQLRFVRQIAVEIHLLPIVSDTSNTKLILKLQEAWNILKSLKEAGFSRAYFSPNIVLTSLYTIPGTNKKIPTCGEVLYIKRKM